MPLSILRGLKTHIAIDFGGSGTRLARWEGWSLETIQTLPADEHYWLWGTAPTIVRRLRELLTGTPSSVGISFSGEVDLHTGRVRRSDRLRDLCGEASLDLQSQLQRVCPGTAVRVVNDGVAAALGAVHHIGTPPMLVLTLGTWPIVQVIDREVDTLRIDTPSWLHQPHPAAPEDTHSQHLRAAQLQTMPEPVRRQRIAQTLTVLLRCYQAHYQWWPSTVVLMGGGAVGLSADKLGAALDLSPARLWLPADYTQQALLPLAGARLAAEGTLTFRCA